jgi:phosphocarrier protein HPr
MSGPPDVDDPCPEPGADAPPGSLVRVLAIVNKKGLHARASAKFVQTVEQFDAAVRVSRCGEAVGGDSIMGLMMLSAGPGTSITVSAIGAQASEVLDALAALIDSRFGEEE